MNRPTTPPTTLDPQASPPRLHLGFGPVHVLAILAVLAACALARDLLVPIFLGMFLALIANPIVSRLHRWWIPRWLGALAVVLGGLSAAVLLASLLVAPAAQWVQQAPTELRQLAPKLKKLTLQVELANKAAVSIAKAAGATPVSPAAAEADKPHAPNLWTLIAGAPRLLAQILAVVLLSFFFLLYGEPLQKQAISLLPDAPQQALSVDILRTIEADLSGYVLTISLINTLLGLLLACALWWLGLDLGDALLWGTLAGLFNFVPYVGPLTGVALLALVGVVAFDSPGRMLLPPAIFLGLHLLESQLVTPIVLGRRMALSPLILLLWLMLWGWLWGIAGLLLAVPMLASAKIVAARVERWQGWARLVE